MDEPAAPAAPAPEAAAAAPAVARTVGERLRAGRERSGLSVPAAAEKLHLDNRVIEALEADRFAELGAPVYVRGHLRRYADFVGENGVELVNMYNARETRQAPPDLTQVPHPERRADPRRLVTPLVVAGSAAVLLAAVWWVLSGSKQDAAPATAAKPTVVVPDDDASVTSLPAAMTATPATLTSSTPVAPPGSPASSASAGDETAPATSTTPTRAEPAEAPPPAREIELNLELTNDSWVEVYDSRGERLFYDVATAGSRSIKGRAPLRVILENAAGVAVAVDGQRRELPAGAVDGDRARFIVNRSGSLSRAR
jgi:cytoskeleton protein RodZ